MSQYRRCVCGKDILLPSWRYCDDPKCDKERRRKWEKNYYETHKTIHRSFNKKGV